jgi:hypothetical protein
MPTLGDGRFHYRIAARGFFQLRKMARSSFGSTEARAGSPIAKDRSKVGVLGGAPT